MGALTLHPPRRQALSGSLRTGIALSAATVATFYALCTPAGLVPWHRDSFMGFMNSLFHGMDFTVLLKPGSFSLGGFVEALLVMSARAVLAGTFYMWARRRLGT